MKEITKRLRKTSFVVCGVIFFVLALIGMFPYTNAMGDGINVFLSFFLICLIGWGLFSLIMWGLSCFVLKLVGYY